MIPHLSQGDLIFGVRTQSLERFLQGFYDKADAARMSLGAIYAQIQRQSMLLAYVHNFRLLAILSFSCIMAVLFLRKVKAKRPGATH